MKSTPSSYMPQLDSLRALAVLAVMIHHWAPGFLGFGPWGDLGVRCFFVLSGFLITGILLRSRASIETGVSTVTWQLRQFYIRRSLRIFPIYYLTLAVGAFLGMQALRDTFWWHAAYGSNFYFALRGAWQGYISHLWSLSVEEQFYLLWPVLILTVPTRRLPALFAFSIAAAILTRAALALTLGPGHIALKVLLPSSLDALVIGAALAWLFARFPARNGAAAALLARIAWPSTIAFALLCGLDHFQVAKPLGAVVGPLVEAIFFAGLIGRCALGLTGVAGRILDLGVLQYLGRISYGLYLYHLFAGYIAAMFAHKLGLTVPGPGPAQFTLFFGMTLAGAMLSERFIERPFNQLKRFFPAEAQPARPTPAPCEPPRLEPVGATLAGR